MRKLVLTLAIVAGFAGPVIAASTAAHAGQCVTNCIPNYAGGQFCNTTCF